MSRRARPLASVALLAAALAAALGCKGDDAPARRRGVEIFPAGPDAVAPLVARAIAQAAGADRQVLVYVGATWCPPCKVFREAVERRELDVRLPGLTLIEFDADEDADRLAAAGYSSQLIPLFVPRRPDGTASERRTEGVATGGDAVADLVPRIEALLTAGPAPSAPPPAAPRR